ncbi:NAD(P)-binding protein [Mumia zhuanghuii]|uniref:FAD-dependent oxidoreductase n=2 Tax=Mumia TaxID=1546255 RepID=A0ABW1QK91_9ACTN|nr:MULTISPECIES: FAD-dependent oxidoreductase [Mumia]KAA1418318.1 NAD(P)-binding protein [Mumia zhuanghuii]
MNPRPRSDAGAPADVLVVGAGPTGLALALELAAQGVDVRVVDAAPDAVHESRAMVIQARTLELLDRHGVADDLVSAGDHAGSVTVHGRGRAATIPLFDAAVAETAYPFLLFLSQAETERILLGHLARREVYVERASPVVAVEQDGDLVTCTVGRGDGDAERVTARYVVGCDGAHSAVRAGAGIAFRGRTYPQSFVLADVEADGLGDGVHAYVGPTGLVFFFPLAHPAPWRVLTARPAEARGATTLGELQRVVAAQTGGGVTVRDPAWMTDFSISERCVDRLRAGRVLLAGDAAHIHSPAGGQGMNTGIQDAVNLGWKLALVCRGMATPALLDTYEAERLPVARRVVATTGRAFRVATSSNPLVRFLRPRAAPRVLPLLARVPALRRAGFRAVSELDVGYRGGPLAVDASGRRTDGVRAGDRLPDGQVVVDGLEGRLHRNLSATSFTLVLRGPADRWSAADVRALEARWGAVLRTCRVGAAGQSTQLLVRPDGYVGHRADGGDLSGVDRYLRSVLGSTAA